MRIVRGSAHILQEKEPELLAFASGVGDPDILQNVIAEAICRQYDAYPAEFSRALSHASPTQALRNEARKAGVPLVTLLYGVPESLAAAVEPATSSSIALGVALAGMEPEVLEGLMTLCTQLPQIPGQLLADSGRWQQARTAFAAKVTDMVYGYELVKVGVPARLFKTFSQDAKSELMVAICRGVPAIYTASSLEAGIGLDALVSHYQAGLPLEYAIAMSEGS